MSLVVLDQEDYTAKSEELISNSFYFGQLQNPGGQIPQPELISNSAQIYSRAEGCGLKKN